MKKIRAISICLSVAMIATRADANWATDTYNKAKKKGQQAWTAVKEKVAPAAGDLAKKGLNEGVKYTTNNPDKVGGAVAGGSKSVAQWWRDRSEKDVDEKDSNAGVSDGAPLVNK